MKYGMMLVGFIVSAVLMNGVLTCDDFKWWMDAYTNGEWREQTCVVESVKKCKELYGLGIDCDYRIISVEEA